MQELRFHYQNLAKHNVTTDEVEDSFLDSKKLVRRIGKNMYWLIGSTQTNRLLQIGYKTEPNNRIYVFHAMNAKIYEKRHYKRRGK